MPGQSHPALSQPPISEVQLQRPLHRFWEIDRDPPRPDALQTVHVASKRDRGVGKKPLIYARSSRRHAPPVTGGVLSGPAPMLTGPLDDPTLSMRDGDGTHHAKTWREPFGRLDGKPDRFPDQWLYRGPFVSSRVGWSVVRLTDGETTRVLDFNRWDVNEEKR